MKNRWCHFLFCIVATCFILGAGCKLEEDVENPFDPDNAISENSINCDALVFDYQKETGCDGKIYNDPNKLEYMIPFPIGTAFRMGLSNCSSSYHGAGNPDQYAYDFDLPLNTIFTAAKPGKVVRVVEDQPSGGGGVGNYVVIDQEDGTFGLYYHAPKNGISVEVGDEVDYGTALGLVGRSGLAGYPHLHFIVVQDGYRYPYNGIPVSFSNVSPPVVVLQSYQNYMVCE